MTVFRMLSNSFEIISGTQPISVGAPHHGTLRNVDAECQVEITQLYMPEEAEDA